MNSLVVSIGNEGKTAEVTDSKLCPHTIKVLAPEFHGMTDSGPFAVTQILDWAIESGYENALNFRLRGKPEEIGLEFHGLMGVAKDEVHIQAKVSNIGDEPIQSGHHSLLVDMNAAADFHDPTGERTFMYAETGWASLAQLIDPPKSGNHTILMGATYNKNTVMWRMIARVDPGKNCVIAFALDKGYAFAGDHPEWPKGFMGGYRWGTINPKQTKTLHGKIYMIKGTLDDLRKRYAKDFK